MEDLLKRILLRVETEGSEKIDRLIEQLRAGDQAAASLQSRFPINMGGGGTQSAGATTPADALASAYAPASIGELQSVLSQFTGEFRGLLEMLRSVTSAGRAGGAMPAAAGFGTPMSGGYSPNLAPDPTLPSAAPLPFAAGVPNAVPYSPGAAVGTPVMSGVGGGAGAAAFTGGGPGTAGNLQALLTNLQSRGDSVSMLEHRLREELEGLLRHGGMAGAVLSGQGAGIPLTESGAQGVQDWISVLNERMGALSTAQGMFSGSPGQTSSQDLQRIQDLLRRSSSLGKMARGEYSLLSSYEPGALSGLGNVAGAGTPFEHLETYMGRMQAGTASAAAQEGTAAREALRQEYESGNAAQRLTDQMDRLRQSTERYQEFLDSISGGAGAGSYAEASRNLGAQQAEERRRRNEVLQEIAGLGNAQDALAASYGSVMTPEERRAFGATRADQRFGAGRMFGQAQDALTESRDALQELREQEREQQRQEQAQQAVQRTHAQILTGVSSIAVGQALQWGGGFMTAGISGIEGALGTGGIQTARTQGLVSGIGGGFSIGGSLAGLAALAIPGVGIPLAAAIGLGGGALGAGIGALVGPNLAEAQWRAQGGPGYTQFLSQYGSMSYLASGGIDRNQLGGMQWAAGMPAGDEADIMALTGGGDAANPKFGLFPAAGDAYGYGPGMRMAMLGQTARTYGYRMGMQGTENMSHDLLAWSRVLGQDPQSLLPTLELMRRQGGSVNQTLSGLQGYGMMMGGGLDLARFGETMGLASGVSNYLQQFSSNPDISGVMGWMGGWSGLPENQRTILGGQTGFSNVIAPTLQSLTNTSMSFNRALLYQMASRKSGQPLSLAEFADLQTNPERFPELLDIGQDMARQIGAGTGQGAAFGAHMAFGLSMPYAQDLMSNDPVARRKALDTLRGSDMSVDVAARAATPDAARAAAATEIADLLKNSENVNRALVTFVDAVNQATRQINRATGNAGPARAGLWPNTMPPTGPRTFFNSLNGR